MYEAARALDSRKSPTSLHEELLVPFPIYAADETQLLPTPVRLQAHPRYAGRGVTLAFLDSGFFPHEDLVRPRNRIHAYADATGWAVEEKTRFNRIANSSWHGLMTSSVSAGNGFRSGGLYCGIAHQADLVLVKTGNRRGRRIHSEDIRRALAWVILNAHRFDIRVVNISLGGDPPAGGRISDLDEMVEEAAARGLVVVCAAGNGGHAGIIPPASAPSAITVGGMDDQNSLERPHHQAYRSNYGLGVNGQAKPELIAPAAWLAAPMLPKTWVHNEALFLWKLAGAGDDELARILDTDFARARFKKQTLGLPLPEIRRVLRRRMIEQKYIHPYYQHVDGTSFAAPVVSSIIAQMLEANPALTPPEVKAILMETAEPLDGLPREKQGAGVVNAPRAVAAALRAPGGALAGHPFSPQVEARGLRLTFYDPEAREVALVSEFNDWQSQGQAFQARGRGIWELTMHRLPPGVYPYKFLVDRTHWMADPENPSHVPDGYGGYFSLLVIEARPADFLHHRSALVRG